MKRLIRRFIGVRPSKELTNLGEYKEVDSMRLEDVKVGDKIKYLGGDPADEGDLTRGKEYTVENIDHDGDLIITSDLGIMWYVGMDNQNVYNFEKVRIRTNISDISSIKFGLLGGEGNVIKEGYTPFEIDLDTTDETVEDISKEETPEVGDLIKFNRDGLDVTKGKIYEIEDVTDYGYILFTDDEGDEHYWSYPGDDYMLIKRKTERELLANLSQEVAELKNQLADLKAEVAITKLDKELAQIERMRRYFL